MIKIYLGNVGSGKTLCAVRDMIVNPSQLKTFTNITMTKPTPMIVPLQASMILRKEEVGVRKNGEVIYDYKLNVEFWKSIQEPINVILDEAHTMVNARRSMSKVNILVTDWLALIRRVLGQSTAGNGELTLISQLHNRIDIIAREMATSVRYHLSHYVKRCLNCGYAVAETSDEPEPLYSCIQCGSGRLKKEGMQIEVWHFASMQAYLGWKDFGINTYHLHYLIDDVEQYFQYYNTLSWENMFSEYY